MRSALSGRCPRCGEGRLFDGWLKVAPGCGACGLDYSTIQTGDGPATFIMQIAGFLVGFSALFVEIRFHPPMWLHLALWIPLVIALSLIAVIYVGLVALVYFARKVPRRAA